MIKFYQIRPCTLLAKQNFISTNKINFKNRTSTQRNTSQDICPAFTCPLPPHVLLPIKKWTSPTVMRSVIGSDFKFIKPLTWTNNNFLHVLKFKIYNTERDHTAVLSKQTLCRRQLDIPAFSWETDLKFDTWNNTDLRSGRLRNTFCAWAKTILYPFPMKTQSFSFGNDIELSERAYHKTAQNYKANVRRQICARAF